MRPKVEIDVLSPEEVWALVRAADSEQDAAIFLTGAFTGLRQGELVIDTTYFFAASIVRAKGSIQSGLASVCAGCRHAASIIS